LGHLPTPQGPNWPGPALSQSPPKNKSKFKSYTQLEDGEI